ENPLERSIYLFSEVEASDFELTFDYRIVGGNSGVQYRSLRLENDDVAGYQADIEDGPHYSGILYESAGRAIMASRGQTLHFLPDGSRSEGPALGEASGLQAAIREHEWNHYRIVADGPLLVHEINGVKMVEVLDQDRDRSRPHGVFALQLHQGPPMEVRFRDIQLLRLESDAMEKIHSAPEDGQEPIPTNQTHWIWGTQEASGQESLWFHHEFHLTSPAKLSRGAITCDNGFRAWLDGVPLAEGSDWMSPTALTPGLWLAKGSHSITIASWNEGGPAGLAARLEFTSEDGRTTFLHSGEDWWSASTEPEGWPKVDRAGLGHPPWNPARSLGAVGTMGLPWGQVMTQRVATPVDSFLLPDGFDVELVHSAGPGQGSWASMTFGPEGEIYLSPERGPLLRFTFPEGHGRSPAVFKMDTPVHSAQGLLFAHGALYANVAGDAGELGDGGLHRLRDEDGDGIFEDHSHLSRYGPASEHGAHGIVLGPDGLLYVVIGNHTDPPTGYAKNSAYRSYAEDLVLPRIWDPRGHAHGMFAPAALVMRTDKDAKRWELVAGGMRNPYDLAFAPNGELFTYDADMEWDIGTPWYRSPRVVHVIPGGESGWRSGSGKWPAPYPDSLPAVAETGPASPVGITFGSGSGFPAPWQDRLFLADWAYGRISTMDLKAQGAGYQGTSHDFLSGKPLNVTDLEFGPDGALWFITGGRGTQSGLYRVTYSGASTPNPPSAGPAPNAETLVRRALERDEVSFEETMLLLGSEDRVLRFAARLNLERRPHSTWMESLKSMEASLALGELLLAAARIGDAEQREEVRSRILTWNFKEARPEVQWLLVRTAMLLRTRGGAAEQLSEDPGIASYFASAFPTRDVALNREIARLLVAVQAPGLPAILLQQMDLADFQEEKLHYALLLRLVEQDWDEELRLRYLTWLRHARSLPGGLSVAGFLSAMESDALSHLDTEARGRLSAGSPRTTGALQGIHPQLPEGVPPRVDRGRWARRPGYSGGKPNEKSTRYARQGDVPGPELHPMPPFRDRRWKPRPGPGFGGSPLRQA
ncbi:MAG: family 16 glycoside hydrolase, partial [Planctomycetota bacterium]